jgi:hypothetical protein
MPVGHIFAENVMPPDGHIHQSSMVSLSVLGGSPMFPTGSVTSLAPQIASPARHPYAVSVNAGDFR